MDEMKRAIEAVWPLDEPLILKDVSTATDSATAISINDTIVIEWDDSGYGISNWQTEKVVAFGKFRPDEVVVQAITAYVKYSVLEDLGRYMDAEAEKAIDGDLAEFEEEISKRGAM